MTSQEMKMTDKPMTLREKVLRAIRENVKVDATGLSPAVASVFIVGIDQATDAICLALEDTGAPAHMRVAKELRGEVG